MNVKHIFKILPKELFSVLSKKYNTDYRTRKLDGETIFKVLLYSMFSENNYTLSKFKSNFENKTFQKKYLKKETYTTIDKTSFHYRLNKIDPNFFKDIYEKTLSKVKNVAPLKKNKELPILD